MNRWKILAAATFAFGTLTTTAFPIDRFHPTLINGSPIKNGTWKEVVEISAADGNCTATIVGPRTVITAAHCAEDGETVHFSFNGRDYDAEITRSPVYSSTDLMRDHDIAVGITDRDIEGAMPKCIGGAATVGLEITLLGYGCTEEFGGGTDGILRKGTSTITRFRGYDMISSSPQGAALCFGDSGGPAFDGPTEDSKLLGINSKGNIVDTNYNTRLDTSTSQEFLHDFASDHGVTLCGINSDCSSRCSQAD